MKEKEFLPYVRDRLGIELLNPMQKKMMSMATEPGDIMLLAPTGSGKTLAFMLPVMKLLKPSTGRVQCVIIAPSRELVIQIAGVAREIARDFRVTALTEATARKTRKTPWLWCLILWWPLPVGSSTI